MVEGTMHVTVRNIGGIGSTEHTLNPGVTILAGRNATNRTSFLQALMAALGSNQASLKSDAEEGTVELSVNGEKYTRTLKGPPGTVTFSGNPYLGDTEAADLFAFLIETNRTRLAVPRGDDLRDIIMQPVDAASIQAEIRNLEQEKREVNAKIEELESLKDRVPELEERLKMRKREIKEKRQELEEKEAELDALDMDLEETRRENNEVKGAFSDLREARQQLENLQFKLETEQKSHSSLEEEAAELEEAWKDIEMGSETQLEEISEELQQRRNEKQTLESEITTLQQVIRFNEEMLEGATAGIANVLRADGGASTDSVVDHLVQDSEVVCWTCGSSVDQSAIKETVSDLRSLLKNKHSAVTELESEIEKLKSEKDTIESQQARANEVARRQREVDEEIEHRESTIRDLKNRIEAQSAEIRKLESEAEATEDESYNEILEVHKEANQLEFELERLRKDVEEIKSELADVRSRIKGVDELERQREAIQNDLQDLRTKIECLETDAIKAFNEQMGEILNILEYQNLERIWLEKTRQQVQSGQGENEQSVFELHIVRSTSDGRIYEDTVDHLSESEREVTGLILGLAGYLVHDLHEVLPVMLLDSLEAIDSERIAALVEHFEQYAEYLIVALLPEDANAIDSSYNVIKEI